MKLSIVIGTYNRRDQLKACIESIERETRTSTIVYVSDAGSTDGTVEYLSSVASDSIRPVLVGQRLGQARAYNDVFAMVNTPYVCWLSDDNVIVQNGIDRAIAALESNQRLGMVGLKTRDMQGPFVDAPYIGGISSIGILNVNQGVLRTQVLHRVGGFSEAFRDYGIDPDLTAKVLFSGHDIALTKCVAIHHYRNWETDRRSPRYEKLRKLQIQYQRRYDLKYKGVRDRSSLFWLAKKAVWRSLQKLFPEMLYINAQRPVLGALPRDWNNIFSGRYISLGDHLLYSGKHYHLVQHCPRAKLPKVLPNDPPPFENELVHVR